ncbi:hypothetical protein HFP72_31070 [Nocardiopsis sp. ARC36]
MFDPEPVERVLGRALPRDYVALMQAYGGVVSTIEDAYLLITVDHSEGREPREAIEEENYPVYYIADDAPYFRFMDDSRKVDTSWILCRDPYNIFLIGEVIGENLYFFSTPMLRTGRWCWGAVTSGGSSVVVFVSCWLK